MEPHDQKFEKLIHLLKDAKCAMLSTVDDQGHIRSRPMMTQQVEFDGHLWFFTHQHSTKVEELEKNPQVNLSYIGEGEQRFISVSGTGEVIRDREKIEGLWNPLYQAWFPRGLNDPELALLRVKVSQAEYWDIHSNRWIQLISRAKSILSSQVTSHEESEHEKIDLAS